MSGRATQLGDYIVVIVVIVTLAFFVWSARNDKRSYERGLKDGAKKAKQECAARIAEMTEKMDLALAEATKDRQTMWEERMAYEAKLAHQNGRIAEMERHMSISESLIHGAMTGTAKPTRKNKQAEN